MESYKRVNKPMARKLYNNGCSVFLLPCKISDSAMDGSHPWVKPYRINIIESLAFNNKFGRAVVEYEQYNCNSSVGTYPHYYVSEEEISMYEMCKMMCN